MRAQRARYAVKSNESKRRFPPDSVRAHKHAVHEAHIGVELVRRRLAGIQVDPASAQVEIPHAHEALEVEDHRGVPSLRMNATRICWRGRSAHRTREIEVGP